MILKNLQSKWLLPMLLVGSLGIWGGCSSHRGLIKQSSITFIQPGVTTKADVTENLGAPTRILEPERVYTYEWEDWDQHYGYRHSHYRREYRPLPSPQHERNVNHHIWAFCVAFDDQWQVTRHAFLDAPESESLSLEIAAWLKSPKQ